MSAAGEDASYPLCFRDTEGRFILRYKYEGITLHPDGMEWTAETRAVRRYADIDAISLTTGYIARSGAIASCSIRFRDFSYLGVTSTNRFGTPDDARNETYIAFVRDLHSRLSADDRKRIRFHGGSSQGRETAGRIILVIAAAFFLVLPLGLFFVTGEWKALGLMIAGGALVWPLWNTLQKNRPRDYDPANLDQDLFP